MGWLAGWSKRVKLTVDAGDIDADLTWFPITLFIDSTSGINNEDITFVFDEVGANSLKIAVTTDDGETQCYVEVEAWSAVTETAVLHVSKTGVVIDDAVNTDFYLYYDSTHANNTDYVGVAGSVPGKAVWDDNFSVVLHLSEVDGNHVNSKAAPNFAIGAATVTPGTPAKIDGGDDFDGDSGFLESATDIDARLWAGVTVEAWFKGDGWNPQTLAAVGGWDMFNGGDDWILLRRHVTAGKLQFLAMDVSAVKYQYQIGTTVLDAGTWYHGAGVWSGASADYPIVYLNGVSDGSSGQGKDQFALSALDDLHDVHIGWSGNADALPWWDGLIDEFRISNVARAVAWIKATYEAGRDHLLDWGAEETSAVGQPYVSRVQRVQGMQSWTR